MPSVVISAAVEGLVDEAVVRKLIVHVGAEVGPVHGKNGKTFLHRKINGYNNAARHTPWIILVDLDDDAECAPPLRDVWLNNPAPHLCFRVAIREVEAWLMSDAETLAPYLSIAQSRVPVRPEDLPDPKRAMVDLARRSRRRDVREDMVPRDGSGRSVGPAYSSRLIEYVIGPWRPDVAAQRADSLHRTIACLNRLIGEKPHDSGGVPDVRY